MPRVAIIDYGLCNLDSIRRAVDLCGGSPYIATEAEQIGDADLLILPGVGAFSAAMQNLKAKNLDEALRQEAGQGKPLLGICLGMQLLASASAEGGPCEGLDLIAGHVALFDGQQHDLRVPHMGWNSVCCDTSDEMLFDGIAPETDFYFVHSYYFTPDDPKAAIATTPYCGRFTSAVRRDNVCGTQFHPEKSQKAGFKLLQNFLKQ